MIFDILPAETTTQALRRLGFSRGNHTPGDHVCNHLRGETQGIGFCKGRHIVSDTDGRVVLGCSPDVATANAWIRSGCPMDAATVLPKKPAHEKPYLVRYYDRALSHKGRGTQHARFATRDEAEQFAARNIIYGNRCRVEVQP